MTAPSQRRFIDQAVSSSTSEVLILTLFQERRWARYVLAAAAVALVAVFGPGQAHDGIYDWLTAKAALDGGDPYAPLHEIAGRYGLFSRFEWLSPHPRLPGALLLQTPLALVPVEWISQVLRAIVAASLIAVTRYFRPAWTWAFLAGAAFHAVWFGNLAAVVTWLVAMGVARGVGWPIGIATVLRVWPWYLGLSLLLMRRPKAAMSAGLVFLGLNLAGLLLPGATWSGTWSLFVEASDRYVENGTNLASYIPWWVAVVAAVAILWVTWWRRELSWAVVGGLLGSPVVWLNYLTVLSVPLGTPRRPPEGPPRNAASTVSGIVRSRHRSQDGHERDVSR